MNILQIIVFQYNENIDEYYQNVKYLIILYAERLYK